jgi:hypothetical protein
MTARRGDRKARLQFTLTHPLAGSRGAAAVRVEAQPGDEGGVVFEGLGAGSRRGP